MVAFCSSSSHPKRSTRGANEELSKRRSKVRQPGQVDEIDSIITSLGWLSSFQYTQDAPVSFDVGSDLDPDQENRMTAR